MAGSYCVLSITEGCPGCLFEAEDWDRAVDMAVAVFKDNDPASAEIIPEAEIREELERDACFASNQGDIWVYILMTEVFEDSESSNEERNER